MQSRRIELLPKDLVEWRLAAGISLQQIAATTKINPYYLEAIESGEFHKLPAGVYTESYIRQYAEAIGDYSELLLEYYRNRSGRRR
jgi:cytoskeletal protein RodZ